MPASTPNSVYRYRPALLVLAGAAAAYATYLVYNLSQSSPTNSLHRSNAVRRPHARQRRHTSQTDHLSALYGDVPALGDYAFHGVRIPLNAHTLITRNELRDIVTRQLPHYTIEEVNRDIDFVYDTFLDRLLAFFAANRLPSQAEIDTIARWVADRHGDRILQPSTAIEMAVARHTSTLELAVIDAVDGAESVAATDLSWRSDEDTEGDALDPDGQILQRTLYHIAEDRARHEGVAHRGIVCNGCSEKPIRGIRWHCANCADYDLCSSCEAVNSHDKHHIFYKIRIPAPHLGITKQEPLYPGKPHAMSSSLDSPLKKRLVAQTKMEAEEVDASWDQFTCLANTEWPADPNNIGWALDRRAFNHVFVPRYNSFAAAPNLVYDRVFAYFDVDKNNLIGFEEWIKGIDGLHATSGHVKSKIVFDGYDVDGDGYISRKDILRIFRAYYAIEKEATQNFVAELTEELSIRDALDTISSSRPLGSAFGPNLIRGSDGPNPHLLEKNENDFENAQPVLQGDRLDIAARDEILSATNMSSRIVTDRWARRQFYTDEEEGLNRPEGAEDDVAPDNEKCNDVDLQSEDLHGAPDQSNLRPRWSRSSSRVRFQDDVDMETRSNASTSSRPFGERWGGYEIPEPEKDLGKEVLYQITQQAFNELLDPLFEDRENDAMDANATRSERRKCATQLEQVAESFKTKERAHNRAICKIGIFRYSRYIADMFCNAVNEIPVSKPFRGIFYDANGGRIDREAARTKLLRIYNLIQDTILDAVNVPDDWTVADMALWNTWLCKSRLQEEMLAVTLDCASRIGWISDAEPEKIHKFSGGPTGLLHRDPTMPQFRPNSTTDMLAASSANSTANPESTNASPLTLEIHAPEFCPGDDQLRSRSTGPFFVCTLPRSVITRSNGPGIIGPAASPSMLPSPTLSISKIEALLDQTLNLAPDCLNKEIRIIDWQSYRDQPFINFFQIDSSHGTHWLHCCPRPIQHSSRPFVTEVDELRPLYRYVRELAMDTRAKSHHILLASLNTVQQEIHERKGGGLISFADFEACTEQGKLRFLESMFEWVSI
jgi:hypothetical protein